MAVVADPVLAPSVKIANGERLCLFDLTIWPAEALLGACRGSWGGRLPERAGDVLGRPAR